MADKFKVEGDLWLYCQEGGFADDAFVLKERDLSSFTDQLAKAVTNIHADSSSLDDMVAAHFKVDRRLGGDRHIGRVRIMIERLDN